MFRFGPIDPQTSRTVRRFNRCCPPVLNINDSWGHPDWSKVRLTCQPAEPAGPVRFLKHCPQLNSFQTSVKVQIPIFDFIQLLSRKISLEGENIFSPRFFIRPSTRLIYLYI